MWLRPVPVVASLAGRSLPGLCDGTIPCLIGARIRAEHLL